MTSPPAICTTVHCMDATCSGMRVYHCKKCDFSFPCESCDDCDRTNRFRARSLLMLLTTAGIVNGHMAAVPQAVDVVLRWLRESHKTLPRSTKRARKTEVEVLEDGQWAVLEEGGSE